MIAGATVAGLAVAQAAHWAVAARGVAQVDAGTETPTTGVTGAAGVLLSVMLLLFVFLVAFLVFRIGRKLRWELRSGSAEPTAVSDVWRMHRLPEEDDEQDEDVADDDPSSR